MIVVGLTGSIGMGKSTVGRMIKDMGYPVHDADAAVHKALGPNGAAIPDIKAHFPSVIKTDENGKNPYVDRGALGKIVFSDPKKLKILEDITHPLARSSREAFLKACRKRGDKLAVLDIPLLFETGLDKITDVTFCVSSAKDIQRARVLARPGMSEERFDKIVASQMPDKDKRQKADFVIATDVPLDETKKIVKKAINEVLQRAK